MSKHTPGPWKAVDQHITRQIPCFEVAEISNMRIICDGVLWPANPGNPETDAKLIAAAPDLLEALQEMVDCYWGTEENQSQGKALAQARAAIRKATK